MPLEKVGRALSIKMGKKESKDDGSAGNWLKLGGEDLANL